VLHRRLESEGDVPVGDRFVPIARGSEEVWLSLTEAVMRDPTGAVSGRIFAFRDISGERAVEQMKSDFVSAVSHELRTPLTSIYGFAETLLRADIAFGEDERRTFLGYIASEAERLTRIVDSLLNVARLDSGDLVVTLSPTDVRPIVSEVVAGVEAAEANGHHFVVDLPDEPLDAHADRDKLHQVLAQLVDNAVKYSPEGGTVTISGRLVDDAIELQVSDQGPGIPHAEQERIFRKFYRGEAATRDGRLGGTGLGLFIAHGLVTAMGGRISVTPNDGAGSSFAVAIPAAGPTFARRA
jgi:signal transduction histidine kinase